MSEHEMLPVEIHTIKAAVRLRDGEKCMECGLTRQQHLDQWDRELEVHRIVPGSDYSMEGCTTLCRVCHYKKKKSPSRTGPVTVKLRSDLRGKLGYLAIFWGSPTKGIQSILEDLIDAEFARVREFERRMGHRCRTAAQREAHYRRTLESNRERKEKERAEQAENESQDVPPGG